MSKQRYLVEKRIAHYNAGRENQFSEWELVGETMAVSEEQAIRNVTWNKGIRSYSSLDHDAGNDEEICIEYRAYNSLLEIIKSDAAHGKPIPKNLDPPEVMLYQSLAALYQRYRSGGITPEQGASEKQVIVNSYKRMRADYNQLHEICKLYQMRLKEGYGRYEGTDKL